MKKSLFTTEQIALALKEASTGTSVEEVCRQPGISQQTYLFNRSSATLAYRNSES